MLFKNACQPQEMAAHAPPAIGCIEENGLKRSKIGHNIVK
jgi:hypothetical protein